MNSPDLSEPVIDAATLAVVLPRGNTITLEASTRESSTWTVRSASPDLVGQFDEAAHLNVTSAIALIANAIAAALSDDAVSPSQLTTAGGQRRPLPDSTMVGDAARLRAQAEDFLEAVVVYEVVSGATWEMIGDDLGIARQNAHKKLSRAVANFKAAPASGTTRCRTA